MDTRKKLYLSKDRIGILSEGRTITVTQDGVKLKLIPLSYDQKEKK